MGGAAEPEVARVDPALCLVVVERVCASNELRRAARLRDFLRYVSQRALEQPGVPVTEQEIGVHVFGRRPDYDTGIDNIVRVNASELRKRIHTYFEANRTREPLHLEIPRGSYTPHFFYPVLEEPESALARLEAQLIPNPNETIATPEERKRQWLLPLLTLVILVLLLTCTGMFFALRRTQQAAEPWKDGSSLQQFWGHLFDDKRNTDIVLADSSLPIVQEYLKRRIPLSLYLKPEYTQLLAHADLPEDLRSEVQRFSSRSITSFTDVRAAKQILDLSPRPGRVRMEYARRFRVESLKSDNVILIGSDYSNPWVDIFDTRLNFHTVTDPATRQAQVINSNPRPGEQAVYASTQDAKDTVGYCTLAFFPETERDPSALIIAGTTSEATEAAVDFVTSEKSMQELKRTFRLRAFSGFELLLRTTRLENTPLSAEIVVARF